MIHLWRRSNGASQRKRALSSLAFTLGAGLVVTGGLYSAARAGGQAQINLTIYRGDNRVTSGITLVNWGSGTIEEESKVALSGSTSLKIVTHGLYQGAGIVFTRPFDLGSYIGTRDAYLQFAILPPPPPNSTGGGPGGPGGYPGYPRGFQGSGGPEGSPGGFPGGPPSGYGGYPGASGSGGSGRTGNSVKLQKARPMENLRVLLITTNNKTLEALLPLSSASEENQWKLLSIPVSQVPGLKADDAQIKEIRLFGDTPGTFYVGRIGVVIDSTPLSVSAQDEKVAPRNAVYRYSASASGGATPLKVSWDWDASDGIQDESQGRAVNHAFRRTGDFIVTITVSDLYGIKKSASTTFKVHVTP
jgi:hypothetical protein